jgi:hypothetical protein
MKGAVLEDAYIFVDKIMRDDGRCKTLTTGCQRELNRLEIRD